MFVVYKNSDDRMNLHYGTVLTPLDKVDEYILYIDILPIGDIVNRNPDWKKQYIKSVSVKDLVCFIDSEELIKRRFAQYFI